MLLNLNNVDDTAIVTEWLMKPPKVRWVPEEGTPKIILNAMKGDLPEEYTCKYTTKGVPKRGTKGDILLACLEKLQPENRIFVNLYF